MLAARQRTLGRDHPDTLATRFSVAQEMAARGIMPGPRKGSGACSQPGSGRWAWSIGIR